MNCFLSWLLFLNTLCKSFGWWSQVRCTITSNSAKMMLCIKFVKSSNFKANCWRMVKISFVSTQDDTLLQAEKNYELRLMLQCSFIYLFPNHVEQL
jgi:hypothetical protein